MSKALEAIRSAGSETIVKKRAEPKTEISEIDQKFYDTAPIPILSIIYNYSKHLVNKEDKKLRRDKKRQDHAEINEAFRKMNEELTEIRRACKVAARQENERMYEAARLQRLREKQNRNSYFL